MNQTVSDLLVVFTFVLIGGVFAAAEMALVSLRESQIRSLATRGRRGERVARLADDPNRFLAALQIGVTLAGMLSAAFGASRLTSTVAPIFVEWGMAQQWATTLAFFLVTLVIAYISLVFGELVPKRLALQRAEAFSLALAPVLDFFSRLVSPVISLLSLSTNVIVSLLGGDPKAGREQMTDEEIRNLLSGHTGLGKEERQIVEDVFSAGDRQVREIMRPRTEVEFLDGSMPIHRAVRVAVESPHSRYPVFEKSKDEIIGFVHVRDLLDPAVSTRSIPVSDLVREVLFVPGTKQLLPTMSEMRRAGSHLAIVADEYGGTAGIVTLEDLVEELVGDIRDEYDKDDGDGDAEPQSDGPWEVEGLLNLEDFTERTGIELPDGPYETVAGFVVSELGKLPDVNDTVVVDGINYVVLALEGRRIDRLRVERVEIPHLGDLNDEAPTPADAPDPATRASGAPGQ